MTDTPETLEDRARQAAVEWHVRLTSGAVSAETTAAFAAWRRADSAHERAYQDIAKLWQDLPQPLLADRRRRLASTKRHRGGAVFRRSWSLAAAASLLLAALAGFFPDYLQYPLADYRTRIGEQSSIPLADGSIVHLNTDTAIDVSINGNERRIVLLRGEAEFDVAHDLNRPFRVAAGATTTEALGTRFIVRYDGRAGAVTLLRGKVRSSNPTHGAPSESVTLLPGQQLTFAGDTLGTPSIVELSNADAWRRGRLLMNFVPLKQVIAEINRYRRNPIRLLDDKLGEREVNIAVDIGQIDAWLKALQQTLSIEIVQAGPLIFLHS